MFQKLSPIFWLGICLKDGWVLHLKVNFIVNDSHFLLLFICLIPCTHSPRRGFASLKDKVRMNVRTCFIVSSVVILSTYLWHNISYGISLAENGYRYPVPTAFFQCKYIYVDMGANIGVHSRFLFEPEKYPPKIKRFHLKEMYELFDKHFGVPSARKEPNFKSKMIFN